MTKQYYDGEYVYMGEGYYWAAGSYAAQCIEDGLSWINYLINVDPYNETSPHQVG